MRAVVIVRRDIFDMGRSPLMVPYSHLSYPFVASEVFPDRLTRWGVIITRPGAGEEDDVKYPTSVGTFVTTRLRVDVPGNTEGVPLVPVAVRERE